MKKILIIEDEQLLREAFEFLLESEGYKVASAHHGQSGLVKLDEFRPDLILLDMLMPVMNGLEFLKKANIRTNYPNVQVIMLSNLSDSLSVKEAPKYNVRKTFIKADLSPAELVSIVREYTKENKRSV